MCFLSSLCNFLCVFFEIVFIRGVSSLRNYFEFEDSDDPLSCSLCASLASIVVSSATTSKPHSDREVEVSNRQRAKRDLSHLPLYNVRFCSNPRNRFKTALKSQRATSQSPQATPRQLELLLPFIEQRPLLPQPHHTQSSRESRSTPRSEQRKYVLYKRFSE